MKLYWRHLWNSAGWSRKALLYKRILSSELHSCLVFPQSMMTKYNHIWNLPLPYNKTNFQKVSHTGGKKKKETKRNNFGVETWYSASLEVGWTPVRGFGQAWLVTRQSREHSTHKFPQMLRRNSSKSPGWHHSPYMPCSRCQLGCCTPILSTPPRIGTVLSGCLQWSACAKQKECFTKQLQSV